MKKTALLLGAIAITGSCLACEKGVGTSGITSITVGHEPPIDGSPSEGRFKITTPPVGHATFNVEGKLVKLNIGQPIISDDSSSMKEGGASTPPETVDYNYYSPTEQAQVGSIPLKLYSDNFTAVGTDWDTIKKQKKSKHKRQKTKAVFKIPSEEEQPVKAYTVDPETKDVVDLSSGEVVLKGDQYTKSSGSEESGASVPVDQVS